MCKCNVQGKLERPGDFISIIDITIIFFPFALVWHVFLLLILDKVVCHFLVKYFNKVDTAVWHTTDKRSLDVLLDAQVDM